MTVLDNPMRFALAGNAVFTIVSNATGARFTYKVRQSDDNAELFFVSLLTGPDNTADFRYFGFIRRQIFHHGGHKAKIGHDAPSAKAFAWFWSNLAKGGVSTTMEIHHEGRCGRCGRALTVPESIQSGFGPECIGRL